MLCGRARFPFVSTRVEATPFTASHGVSRALPGVDTGGVPCPRDATRLRDRALPNATEAVAVTRPASEWIVSRSVRLGPSRVFMFHLRMKCRRWDRVRIGT
jgi:hypothetical protein